MSEVNEVSHPLIESHLARLRSKTTSPPEFRLSIQQLTVLLAYEATKDLEVVPTKVETPIQQTTCHVLQQRVGLIPILRAGLGMVDPLLNLLPMAEVWHLGLYRDEETASPVRYYNKLDASRPVDVALILDPMLATGGSAVAAMTALRDWGVPDVKLLAVIAAQAGIDNVALEFPKNQVFVCSIDAKLNAQKFIVPGLGDAGDRIFNTSN
jgi:uracil phosphoribosyltransferase